MSLQKMFFIPFAYLILYLVGIFVGAMWVVPFFHWNWALALALWTALVVAVDVFTIYLAYKKGSS